MAISRMQEPRQLYGLGSLVRKITRPIKKAVKGIGKVAKSPLGKAALLAAAGYGLGGGFGSGGFKFGKLGSRLGLGSFTEGKFTPNVAGSFLGSLNPFGQNFNLKNLGITATAAGALLPFIAPNLLAPKEEEIEEIDITQTPESIALLNQRARDFYNYGDDDLLFMPQKQYIMRNFYAAKGGLADEEDEEFDRNLTGIMRTRKQKGGSVPESKVKGYDTPAGFNKFDYPTGGVPVRTPKKQGGLMDLGGLEMDFRAEGGFVPIGAKEKADDVPARLSKNEFVMTADAVRGAGKGSIKAGAQKMYNTMKELERRVG